MRDSVNSRYSSDPCKVIGVGDREEDSGLGSGIGGLGDDVEVPNMPAPPTPISSQPYGGSAGKGLEFSNQLPVDEDDYLQPKSSNPRAYMDLVDGNSGKSDCMNAIYMYHNDKVLRK